MLECHILSAIVPQYSIVSTIIIIKPNFRQTWLRSVYKFKPTATKTNKIGNTRIPGVVAEGKGSLVPRSMSMAVFGDVFYFVLF